ncbi:UDP-N-acetylmuramate dehydrogenase [Corynebacterium callunae]|uniref:UDP-N-acetylenolpyruvoylglucosamine reductase n=1 Tax=Corynebacterium callunae DSM 20147 TaxID=1121353 RepID=M1URT7_9CORY|nr:UDP-N-acetylmuramate dehydrogenase [Corynebacterium callunae]AGG65772.1 UDP-N-acetylenolpyruvoylglucosamine reductase [Corynebacterium callunae DSM 20147]
MKAWHLKHEEWSNEFKVLIESELNQLLEVPVRRGVNLRNETRWKIGGIAEFLIEPSTIGEIQSLVAYFNKNSLPFTFIGATSNILFDSRGISAFLVKIGDRLNSFEVEAQTVTAGAGISVPSLVRRTSELGLAGITHAAGIPGTLGGLVVMNGGTQRKGIGENVNRIWVVDTEGDLTVIEKEDLQFSYRDSILKEKVLAVVTVELSLTSGDRLTLMAEIEEILSERSQKFPQDLPNCGSTFLSDPSMYQLVGPPGRAIEEAGLKGLQKGDAQISELHSNFIVNTGNATDNDVLWLIAKVRREVEKKTGYLMNCEVLHMDQWGNLRPAHEVADQRFVLSQDEIGI